MQGCPGDGGGAGCTRRRSPPTDGCCIFEEVEAQTGMHAQHIYYTVYADLGGGSTDMRAQHTVEDALGGRTNLHARYTQYTMN